MHGMDLPVVPKRRLVFQVRSANLLPCISLLRRSITDAFIFLLAGRVQRPTLHRKTTYSLSRQH